MARYDNSLSGYGSDWGEVIYKGHISKQSLSEPIRLRQKIKCLQQFTHSLDSEDVIMKAAFLAVIVAVLSLQGSESLLLGGGLPLLDGLLNLLNGLLLNLKITLQSGLSTLKPNLFITVLSVTADVSQVFTRIYN